MLLDDIRSNIIKAEHSSSLMETNFAYKIYKTFGGTGQFELKLRNIYNTLIDLNNFCIASIEAIMRMTENKEVLSLIERGYFRQYTDAMSSTTMFRINSLAGFSMPETALHMIEENRNAVSEMKKMSNSILKYNNDITNFRYNRNKLYVTLYPIPSLRSLPNVIDSNVNIESILPREILSSTFNSSTRKKFDVNNNSLPNRKRFEIN